MGFLCFSNGFKALVLRGSDNFVFMNPKSLKQQIIRGPDINDMKLSGYLYRQIVRLRLI